MYSYLLINLFAIIIPLMFSFEKRICYARKWKHLFPAMAITAMIFVCWDYFFTLKGIWGFNTKYLMGWHMLNLPVEEVLFFFCIPFSCIFIYELIRHFQKTDIPDRVFKPLMVALIVFFLIIGILNINKAYTSTASFLLAAMLAAHHYLLKSNYLSSFFQMYVISFIPFLIVNGFLTNGLTFIDAGPIVWYNNAHNLSIRILNIPVEDFMYSMLLLLINLTLYECFKNKCA